MNNPSIEINKKDFHPRVHIDALNESYKEAVEIGRLLEKSTNGESNYFIHDLATHSYFIRMSLISNIVATPCHDNSHGWEFLYNAARAEPDFHLPRAKNYLTTLFFRCFIKHSWKSIAKSIIRVAYGHASLGSLPKIFHRLFKYYLPRKQASFRRGGARLYVLLSDGPSLINTRSCLQLCSGLRCSDVDFTVLSNNALAVEKLLTLGIDAHQIAQTPSGTLGAFDIARCYKNYSVYKGYHDCLPAKDLRRYILANILDKIILWSAMSNTLQRELKRAFEAAPPAAFITLGESHLMSMVAQDVARPWTPTWFGWNHILICPLPGNLFFPADRHLFYGQQGLDTYIAAGGNPAHATIVGSPTYDSSVDRDAEKDRDETRRALPAWDGISPLVVIGTENREGQDYEVAPTMEALAALTGVTIVLKLHPEDSAEHYTDMARRVDPTGRKVFVVGCCDLDALLHTAVVLVTMYSNILVNAASVSTPTIVYDFRDTPRLAFDVEGVSLLATTPEQVVSQVRRLLEDTEFKRRTVETATRNITRFIGPGDGQSVRRVVSILRGHLAMTRDA